MTEMRTRQFQIVRLVSLTTLMVSILAIVAKSQTSTASLKGVVDDGSGQGRAWDNSRGNELRSHYGHRRPSSAAISRAALFLNH
jgi:hypothetical protein